MALAVPLSRFTPGVGGGSAFFVRLLMRYGILTFVAVAILAIAITCCTKGLVSTEAHLYGHYTNMVTAEAHYDIDLLNYKRSFLDLSHDKKQPRWGYLFDLVGQGPHYSWHHLSVLDDIASARKSSITFLHVASGDVTIDPDSHTMTIDIQVEQAGVTNQFIGNGRYEFR